MYDWVSLCHLTYLTLPLLFIALATLAFSQLQGTLCSFFPRVFTQLYPQPGLTSPLGHPHSYTLSTHQGSSKGYFLKGKFTSTETKSNSLYLCITFYIPNSNRGKSSEGRGPSMSYSLLYLLWLS